MAQRNVARGSERPRQNSGGSGRGSPSHMATTMFPYAKDLQIAGSTFNNVRGSIVNNYNLNRSEPAKDIWFIFRSIPNFRRIYLDMLSKATDGTGMWLLEGDKFRIWLEPNGDIKIFWGSGMPGAGKTLLASIVIEQLETLHRKLGVKVCVCYFYFRYSERAEATVRTILEVLVKQTLERHPEFRALVEEAYSRHLCEDTEPTEDQLLALLRQLNERVAITFYILDALDEAPTKIRRAIIRTLSSLNVKLFVTSRPLKTIEGQFPDMHTFAIEAHAVDLDLHISKVIEDSEELAPLLQADPNLRDEIFARVKQNCGGMFLHASLQLAALCRCLSAGSLRATLDTFPSSIQDVYRETWARITDESHEHATVAKAVLVWVLNASRSMTIDELECAVATSPVTHKYKPDLLVPGATLISICGGLVTVEEESRLVRLVHYTAKQSLEGFLQEAYPHPHSLLANVCMTHLAECGFQNTTISSEEELQAVLEKDPLLAYASEAWAFHARAALNVEQPRIAQFIRDIHAFPAFTSLDHSTLFDILSPVQILAFYNLPFALLEGTTNPNVTSSVLQQSALMLATRFGYEEMITSLLALSKIQVNSVNNNGSTALMLAALFGHEGCVKLLLAHVDIQVNLVDNDGWSALMQAAANGHEGCVKLLLAHINIQVNLVKNDGLSALMLAAANGYEGCVKLLLAHVDIQVNLVDNDGWSALMLAARNGHEGCVKLLLARVDIQVNLVNNNGCSALMQAAGNGQEGCVKLLLAHIDIQVNLVDNDGWSTLMRAACAGHEGCVKLLLAHSDIQVNLPTNHRSTALLLAAEYGHHAIVECLLATGNVDVNAFDNDTDSALKMASKEGHEEVVRLLLAVPHVDAMICSTKDGHTAESAAQANGHLGIVSLLQDFESGRALQTATYPFHQSFMQHAFYGDGSDSDVSEYFDAEDTSSLL